MNNRDTILRLNANLKYIEYLLNAFDNENGKVSLEELRKKFKNHFKLNYPLLNQYFGIVRLIPLLLIKEVYKNQNKQLEGDIEKIKIIRDSLAHNNFIINENEFIFSDNKKSLKMTYNDFQIFLHKIENDFYI
ncbi:hypothetical protein A2303_03270 [Candidatus Falkowbacteria bacterium RIFOXYB2_FULL_47_14]|uniref:Uncharacterized protein n=1 Tax=Candidatus Falkowbacteria bacterium RIFOXYA2_FULL_47_19 TaxID=1797994 RepID=A0A1F5SKB1_9BACT|nr:MAG: hypothetical protein A2227_04365 [Candidatus Falkowbacteria bacterium RIFOXYA2_FULL_47_19]OGF36993.1 MAG: hypothetical protein A2468_01305 [Candidatus Falkowbacteria bacterium RIFOXYC2_FULL_46_15]OGF44029.1 MAG: hypothetical protein A2303_03270 [Candidatus Falkowbacteria bacterium RIFOXYB2_FULL_47_14]